MGVSELVERVRVHAHTGDRRCLPCTVVNAVLALLVALGVVVGLRDSGPAVSMLGGSIVLFVSAALIYLRGYLVPGTPWLTRTYLPDRVLRYFETGHGVGGVEDTPAAGSPDFDVEALLTRGGVVTEREDGSDLRLTDAFRTRWWDEMESLEAADVDAAIARFLERDPTDVTVTEPDGHVVVHEDGRPLGRWESRPALIADLAADRALGERVDGWSGLDLHRRSSVLQGLRAFLDRCPACDGRVTLGERPVESCCRSGSVVAVRCEDCAVRIAEIAQMG